MPFFLKHYSSFAEKIIVYDNYSTDASVDIIRDCSKAELRLFDTGGTFDDQEILRIKNSAYKESLGKADFVIVVDTDELLYHPNIHGLLVKYKRDGVTLPKILGFNMVSWSFPRSSKPITEVVRIGRTSDSYAKRCIFHPSVDINFRVGCHSCLPSSNIVESDVAELKLLHYHYLGLLHCLGKHRVRSKRLSKFNIENNFGYQFRCGILHLLGKFLVDRVNSFDIFSNKPSVFNAVIAPPFNMIKKLYWTDERRMR